MRRRMSCAIIRPWRRRPSPAQACLLSHCYHAAAPFLAEEIYNVAPDLCATTPRCISSPAP